MNGGLILAFSTTNNNGYNISYPESMVQNIEILDSVDIDEVEIIPPEPQDESLPLVHLIHTGGIQDLPAATFAGIASRPLQMLDLCDSEAVTDVLALAGCASLRTLNLSGCSRVKDVSALAGARREWVEESNYSSDHLVFRQLVPFHVDRWQVHYFIAAWRGQVRAATWLVRDVDGDPDPIVRASWVPVGDAMRHPRLVNYRRTLLERCVFELAAEALFAPRV